MTITKVVMVLMLGNMLVSAETENSRKDVKSRRRKLDAHPRGAGSSVIISPDPMMTGSESGVVMPGAIEVDFDKSIEDMVSQVRNNPNLSINQCVVDRKLWMSNSRSLSPWSYRINHDEERKPVDIPEAVCSCVGCINPFTMQEDRSMTSTLIYTKIPVRRIMCHRPTKKPRKNKKCEPRYRTVVESIAVGCTCIVG
ncbi:interleukin-17B isoform X2 [Misgurnus anguillicaudatus]|uniref:interleukin-17B isoform X2 n=1 Tax=Misgurnus anguillicaudatus TaxID=75329 RepID=UPI002434FCA0|nr:interleukin-17B-like isoform X2 [Misgurnus anguillicaudatus]